MKFLGDPGGSLEKTHLNWKLKLLWTSPLEGKTASSIVASMRSIYAVFLIKLQYALLKAVNLQVSEDLKSLHHVHDTPSQTGQVKETLKPSWSFLERHAVMEMTDTFWRFLSQTWIYEKVASWRFFKNSWYRNPFPSSPSLPSSLPTWFQSFVKYCSTK